MNLLWLAPILILAGVLIFVAKSAEKGAALSGVLCAVVSIILVGSVLAPTIEDYGKDDIDVYVVAGQSNSAYLHYDLEQSTPVPLKADTYFYGTSSKPIVYGTHSTPSYDSSLESYSIQQYSNNLAHLEGPFSSVYSSLTNHKVCTVNVGISGTSIQEWQDDGFAWIYAEKVIKNALSKLSEDFHPILKGFIWIQGESNSAMTEAEYSELFLNTFGQFNSLGFKDCFISKVRRDTSTSGQRNPIGPSDAQIALSESNPHIHMATQIADTFTIANGMMESDNLHYNQLGQNKIGVAVGEYCAAFVLS